MDTLRITILLLFQFVIYYILAHFWLKIAELIGRKLHISDFIIWLFNKLKSTFTNE